MAQRNIRLPDELDRRLVEAARVRGFNSASALIREAVANELGDRAGTGGEMEARIAASLDRQSRELRRLGTALQAHFALTDALVKVVLLSIPEPPADVYEQAKARAKVRYERFLKSVAISMKGDSRAALLELVNHDD